MLQVLVKFVQHYFSLLANWFLLFFSQLFYVCASVCFTYKKSEQNIFIFSRVTCFGFRMKPQVLYCIDMENLCWIKTSTLNELMLKVLRRVLSCVLPLNRMSGWTTVY